ncbi:family 16 glycosylhydrolase [Micromonospora sp. WMMD882]|uniref:glycoside hydrolase family 16 protein n=1 Tax=Micromonospora sp. WMMD882 TaxID=3015151 RepID=UPI00248BE988|nr:glycoside hydrolase family 16 protein [Micromonospora sp. WMMD882]WBB77292.1 family 16 glycosylhydrolase [Micromonospora sp. WMMD882]
MSVLPLFADDDTSVTLDPIADTTATQVVQDGDNSVKTTLASCPRLCDRNPNGRRDALLEFTVKSLPAGARDVRATLRVHAWEPFAARVFAHFAAGPANFVGTWAERPPLGPALDGVNQVDKGHNEWDVSGAVTGNGSYTFALTQQDRATRIYWASRDNSRPELRPQLVVTYKSGGRPAPSPSRTTVPPKPSPAPTTARPTVAPTTVKPTPSATPSPPAPRPTPPAATTPPPGVTVPGWRLVWSDDFNGAAVDRAKWNLRTNEARDMDKGCNTNSPKNTFVSGGMLTLRALRETTVCGSETRQYTQSYLDTIGRHSWTYGRFEVRAKSPNGPNNSKGLWPAFWLRPEDGGNGEIDVVELPGGKDWHRAATSAIFYDYKPTKQDARHNLPSGYPGDGFHTYTTEWERDSIRWYIDGRKVWERNRSTTPWFDEVFHKPYNLRLNFQVGGWLGDPDGSTAFPADFQVDYVRVWQR